MALRDNLSKKEIAYNIKRNFVVYFPLFSEIQIISDLYFRFGIYYANRCVYFPEYYLIVDLGSFEIFD